MKSSSSMPLDGFGNSRTGRRCRLIPLAALVILFSGFATNWVSASRDHPARVSYLDGLATYEASGDVDWNELTLNLPLVSGDRIIARPDSRIEVELGDGNVVRISGETDVLFPELSQKKTILKIHEGDLILRVEDARGVLVELEQASVKIRKKGLYRIQVDPDGSIRLVVHEGRAEVSSRHGKERVETGQELLLDGRRIGTQALVRDLDEFEQWSGSRDAVMVSSRSTGYLGGIHFPGADDLDSHGYWAHYGTFGHVWVPDASAGWVPFRMGRWCNLSSGLTWVSHEPWGWLPYHYGRWIYYGPTSRWAWVPGGFNRYRAAAADFFWGRDYVGWAPLGFFSGPGSRHNWDPRYHSMYNGLTVVHRNDLGRGPARTRVATSEPIVGGLKRGLPRDLRRSRVWNRNSVYSSSGMRASRLASRTAANSRDGIMQGGPRRPAVTRSDTEGTRTRQSFRSASRNRSFSRTSPGTRGSFSTRSSRDGSRPSVWSSRRSRSGTSPSFSGPSGRSSSRSMSRTPSSMPTYNRTTPTYRSPAPSSSRSPSPRVRSAPRSSGSSGGASRSRSTSRSRN